MVFLNTVLYFCAIKELPPEQLIKTPMNKDLILREKLALQRTVMANQTTLLSFVRTSMYFLVAGVSIKNLTTIKAGQSIEILFIAISVALLSIGFWNYFNQKKKIRKSEVHIGNYQTDYLDKN
jgi:putative membrane protein